MAASGGGCLQAAASDRRGWSRSHSDGSGDVGWVGTRAGRTTEALEPLRDLSFGLRRVGGAAVCNCSTVSERRATVATREASVSRSCRRRFVLHHQAEDQEKEHGHKTSAKHATMPRMAAPARHRKPADEPGAGGHVTQPRACSKKRGRTGAGARARPTMRASPMQGPQNRPRSEKESTWPSAYDDVQSCAARQDSFGPPQLIPAVSLHHRHG